MLYLPSDTSSAPGQQARKELCARQSLGVAPHPRATEVGALWSSRGFRRLSSQASMISSGYQMRRMTILAFWRQDVLCLMYRSIPLEENRRDRPIRRVNGKAQQINLPVMKI